MPRPALPHRLSRRFSLQALLLGSYLGLLAPALLFLVLWAGFNLQRALYEREAGDLDARAASLAPLLREPLALSSFRRQLSPQVVNLVKAYAQSTGATVTVVDGTGRVFISSDDDIPFGALISGPEFNGHPGRRWDGYMEDERTFAAAPILEDARTVWGFVQVSRPTDDVAHSVRTMWFTLAAAAALVLGASAAVSLMIARQIARPVQALTLATEAVAGGDLNRSVVPSGPRETQRLADAFNRMSAQVRATLTQQEAFVANAAHELRSPLASMQLRLEMIDAHGQADPGLVSEYLRKLRDEVSALHHMTEELLTLSVTADPERSTRTSEDLAPLLYEVADQYGPLAQHAGLRLQSQLPAHLTPVPANRAELAMVFRNLLNNAIKFTPAGGDVTLEARETANAVEVRVSDTGRGIAPEALPHIFDRFFREDRSDHRGAGLGLALVKAVVESHGGEVAVQSRQGVGSMFTVRLPKPAV